MIDWMGNQIGNLMLEYSRRGFLKASSLAALGTAFVDAKAQEEALVETHPGPHAQPTTELVGLVNILQGTDSTPAFSRGNTLPIAALPFGMAHWTLQSQANTPWMFSPGVRRIQGLRCTHQLSPWLDDYGHAVFLPFSGEVNADPSSRASSYRPEDAKLTPYSLQLFLLRYRANVELIPTERCCLLTASFETSDGPKVSGLTIDILGKGSVITPDPSNRRIAFTSTANAG